ncbi:MAG: hypothetical protein K6B70_08025 [Clostridia bacterium]|nr:hypothetical protein [Clostridia bacterium]
MSDNNEANDDMLNSTSGDIEERKQKEQEKKQRQDTMFGRAVQQVKNDMKEKAKQKAKNEYIKAQKAKQAKKAAKAAKKAGKTAGKAAKVATPWGATIFLIVLLIVIIVGIVSFISSMPGLVQQQIMNKVLGAVKTLQYTLNGSDYYLSELASDPDRKAQKDVLKYLDDMGIDPAGFGFAPFYHKNSDGTVDYNSTVEIEDVPQVHEFFTALIENWKTSKKTEYQDLIFKYIVSNERTYLVDDEGTVSKIFRRLGNGPFYEALFGSNDLKGMIKLRLEGGLGNDTWHKLTVDRESKTLVIATANISETEFKYEGDEESFGKGLLKSVGRAVTGVVGVFLNIKDTVQNTKVDVPIQVATYDLSSFAGRYGTPLEMLLALHLATMSSDLPEEMITNPNLQTEVSVKAKLDTYDTDFVLSYDGKTLPIKLGSSGFSDVNMHDYIFYDEANNASITTGYERAGITIRSLSYWTDKITRDKAPNPQADQQTVRALAAKNALLGSDEFYIKYQQLDDIGKDVIIFANVYRRATKEDVVYLGPATDETYQGNPKIHGLQYYINGHESEIKNSKEIRNGIQYMLSQLDACLVYEDLDLISNYEFKKGNLLLTQEWIDFTSDSSNLTNEKIHEELVKLTKDIAIYFDIVENKEVKMQQILDSIFGDGIKLTPDDFDNIIENAKDLPGEFEFAMPKIEYVIKHWFKDIVFEYNGIKRGAYATTDSTQPIPIANVPVTDNHQVEIQAILTSGNAPSQSGEPYVVKGDIVTLEGEQVLDSNVENIEIDGYHIGDGYRTTKKLFTQGKYYTFDGTRETAQSIYYAKELEKLNPYNNQFAIVHVRNGRITVINTNYMGGKPAELIGDAYSDGTWNVSSQFIADNRSVGSLKNAVKKDPNGNWEVFLASAYKSGADVYYVKANKPLYYLSVGTNSYEDCQKSVESINLLLETMGVSTIRKPISFDNTTASGEIVTLTAFQILEGMHTEEAELIYKDLKEMLIELGYFTKAEFDQISTNVLDWFIPDFKPSSKQWRQNREEDSLYYGAILYPASMQNKLAEEKKKNGNSNDNTAIPAGFEPDLEVVAPGNARISELLEDGITLVFDGISEPEIGALDKYSLSIQGIAIDRNAEVSVIDSDGNESQMSIQSVFESDGTYIVLAGQVIGHTADTKIQLILKNNRNGYIDNIEDYMAPSISATPTVVTSDAAYFYFSPYEGRPESVSGRNENEVAVGICQWTIINGSYNNISPFCKWLVEQDPALCGELETFVYWREQDFMDDYWGAGQLKNAFEKVNYRDSEKFRALQEQYAKAEKEKIIQNLGLGWVLDRSSVTAGTLFSLVNWGPYMGWEDQINPSMTDEEIIKALLKYACTKSSTAGSLNARWESQAKLAIDILYGNFTDIAGWRANKAAYPQYGEGNNSGYLTK